MSWLPYAASGALGIIVGWLIWTLVHKSTTLTVKTVTSLASLAGGGVVIAAASVGAKTAAGDAVYVYPIGALLAILVLGSIEMNPDAVKKRQPPA